MMGIIWVVLFLALTGSHLGHCSPLRSTPQTYPHDIPRPLEGWGSQGGVYAVVPALAFVLTAVGLLLGCTWCYRHKDCKLFTASATHLHDGRRAHPPDSGFSEPANNNISEDNNNGPISLREMQNIANNNAAAYIVSENEERNRVSRESVVEFEPLPAGIRVADPLEHCADWFGDDDFPRDRLQYLREIGRGWFGRVVEGEIEEIGETTSVAVKILNQNATLEDKARFLDEAKMFRDVRHENVLAFIAKCLQEEPWILLFELCTMDLQQYLVVNRPKMAILNESGVPLRLMCDVSAALAHLHSRGYLYGSVWSGAVQTRGSAESARGVLGRYGDAPPPLHYVAPETRTQPPLHAYTSSSDLWSFGTLVWEVCAWGAAPAQHPPPLPDLPCPYRNHLYQVMQLCWTPSPEARPTASQVHALINHLYSTHREPVPDATSRHSADFEQRWQRLKPNSIPTRDEHRAIVHAPSTSMASHFTGSDDNVQTIQDSLSIDMDTAVSRSSSITSDKDPLSIHIKSESLTNLHGSLEDVRNIYLTHKETAALECHQGNISLEDSREKEQDRSDASMDPWLKEIIAGSQDDVSYYKDVSDVIKNLDNILNSEKTSSSESSHQASPCRDNLSLDCKKDYPVQSSMVKSPGITNFQNILDTGLSNKDEDATCEDDDIDRDTIGTLSHSFERYSDIDTTSQHTLENVTPDTPIKDIDVVQNVEIKAEENGIKNNIVVDYIQETELPNEIVSSISEIPKLKELCVASIPSASDEQFVSKDCQSSCDNNLKSTDVKEETKSIDDVGKVIVTPQEVGNKNKFDLNTEVVESIVLPPPVEDTTDNVRELDKHFASIVGKSLRSDVSIKEILVCDLIKERTKLNSQTEDCLKSIVKCSSTEQISESVQNEDEECNKLSINETETQFILEIKKSKPLPPEVVQNIFKDENDIEKKMIVKKKTHNTLNETIVNEMENNGYNIDLLDDSNISEEHNNLVLTGNDSEEKTLSEVNEYTKWINCGSFPQTIQVLSDFLHSEREQAWFFDVRNIPDKHFFKTTCDDDLESISEGEYFESPIPEAHKTEYIAETNHQFLEDSIKSSLDVNDDVLQEIASEVLGPAKAIEIVTNADVIFSLKQNEMATQVINETKLKTDCLNFSNTLEINASEVTETISEISDNVLTEVIDINKTEKDPSYVEEHKELPVDLVTENKVDVNDLAPIASQNELNLIDTQSNNTNIEEKSLPKEEDKIYLDMGTTSYIDQSISDLAKDVNITEVKIVESAIKNHCAIDDTPEDYHFNAQEKHVKLDSESHTEQPLIDEPVSSIKVADISLIKDISIPNAGHSEEKNHKDVKNTPRSEEVWKEISDDSTAYMDLTNDTKNEILPNNNVDNIAHHGIINLYLESSNPETLCSAEKNESTEYLDLPSLRIKDVDNFLHMERVFTSNNAQMTSSTPLASDNSANANTTIENSVKENENESQLLFDTKVPNYGPGVTLTKLEQKYVPDSLSPFESPTKSHPTDTYDENSSVVLGPFENCTLELFKGVKSSELVDFPKEELLAFSSNFSDINLETPSPLRDGNFLNEVPDIVHDDVHFDDIQSLSEKPPSDPTESDSGNSGTEKRISPSTPPNSPGVVLASTSQQKYLVDIDITPEPVLILPSTSIQNEIELNQIELQITSKLAIAENENNMNIEYSGPLSVEGLGSDEGMLLRESDTLPESYLAGNGGSMEDLREDLTLDEECVKALRNELELKLPLAQVAAIEPPCENETEWSAELPPPPELVVSYPGALSPIAEETGQQLSAYENDMQWNVSNRTDSSESYPEPCNNSTDDVTELPTAGALDHSTYTLPSRNHTYTLHRDLASSREITMSADSLNASPYRKPIPESAEVESPVDDKTYTKEEEKESLERISQVSPFLISPTTDSSAPDNSDNFDNGTGVSTLSKTTLPTDAKLSKPSETQCLSKATSIDSWCSNDTLYNVEENFDDLAMDSDVPDLEAEKDEVNSESSDTLTHNEEEKEASHCSTYIIHDSKSEACETFSPDSITANDNYTYTKAKTENAGTTQSVVTTKFNDSTQNSQTKDLAYGTLMSGLPSYSNCTTEIASGLDDWKIQQPELVRKSPMANNVNVTPCNTSDDKVFDVTSPQLATEPSIKKMESVEISCLYDNLTDSHKSDMSDTQGLIVNVDSPNYNYKNMAPSVTSTPLADLIDDADMESIPMKLPEVNVETTENSVTLPNFQTFLQSAEVRPQDLSSNASNHVNQETEVLLEGDSKTLSRNSNRDSLVVSERTPTYSDFENSAVSKPQEVNASKSSQSNESGISSEDFQRFENSVKSRPQDLSSLIDASFLLLKNERISSELAMASISTDHGQTSQETYEESQQSPHYVTNLNESHSLVNFREPNFLLNFDADDETEQPHSIIITETTMEAFKECPSRSYEADKRIVELNHTYDAHSSNFQPQANFERSLEQKINSQNTKTEKENLLNNKVSSKVETVTDRNSADNLLPEVQETSHMSLPIDIFKNTNVQNDCNGSSEKFATVNFLNETFEELIESNVDDGETKESEEKAESEKSDSHLEVPESPKECKSIKDELREMGVTNSDSEENGKLATVTEDFLQNEKRFCRLDAYLPLLTDIRFSGPATEIMSTSFTQDSPTEPTSGECARMAAADIIKEWDSDTDSHTSNSSSGEFIWKDGDGHETSVVPTTHFDHERTGESQDSGRTQREGSDGGAGSAASDASGDSGSGSEGDEVEFVPSSWDCRAAPAKSSLRSLEQATPDNKKRVVFKRQKYHCVYEYPREAPELEAHSPAAYLPDFSTYSEWDPSSAEEAELGYGQLFGAPSPLDLYPLRAGIAFGPDYDEDFFISSSARPFESLGMMTSQFFPGKHIKPSLLERDLPDDIEEFPPPPSPLPTTTLIQTRTPSLDFTTPDSGVEDITPGSTTDEDFKKKLPENELTWRPVDSGSSSESVSPSSPGGEALGGLRHTRDKLKLDLPPSPHIPSPRHTRVFNFVLDKPKRREERPEIGTTPLVMTDETPIVTMSLPLQKECEDLPVPEPTFSTFGKSAPKAEPEQKLILTDEVEDNAIEVKDESPSPKVVEPVKGEGTVLDSGDEDSGIESSSKATLERNKTNVS